MCGYIFMKCLNLYTRKQAEGYKCGYYVMKHVFNIFSADIVDSWDQVYTMS